VLLQSACSEFETQTESREVVKFIALEVSGLSEVIITQANEQKLLIKVSNMPLTDVVTYIENETLIITTKGFHRKESVQVLFIIIS
jgi:rRNA pseudouridine-1189 N-methylase Emg1 (Nep1/Mra1 family)